MNVTGAWLFDVQTSAGSGTPTMTFKQDGEKLTGQYSGQLGEAPLTGTRQGLEDHLPDRRGRRGHQPDNRLLRHC